MINLTERTINTTNKYRHSFQYSIFCIYIYIYIYIYVEGRHNVKHFKTINVDDIDNSLTQVSCEHPLTTYAYGCDKKSSL